jgi:hypothetical protein
LIRRRECCELVQIVGEKDTLWHTELSKYWAAQAQVPEQFDCGLGYKRVEL